MNTESVPRYIEGSVTPRMRKALSYGSSSITVRPEMNPNRMKTFHIPTQINPQIDWQYL